MNTSKNVCGPRYLCRVRLSKLTIPYRLRKLLAQSPIAPDLQMIILHNPGLAFAFLFLSRISECWSGHASQRCNPWLSAYSDHCTQFAGPFAER